MDGQFGRPAKWAKDISSKHKVSDVETLAALLNERDGGGLKDNPSSPQVDFVVFQPPHKNTLYKQTLSGETMRKNKMSCQGTLALSSSLTRKGDKVKIQDHRLTGKPVQYSCTPCLILKKKVEKDEDVAEDDVAGKPHPDGWRRSYRNAAPEKEDPNLSKLIAQYDAMATDSLRSSVPLSGRSKTKTHAKQALAKQQQDKKLAAASVRKHVTEAQRPSSSSSSQSWTSDSSSSSASSSS